MGRPCAHPYCDEQLPDDAPRNKRFHDDTCGRDCRRMNEDGDFALVRAAEAFWTRIRASKPLLRGFDRVVQRGA